MASDPSVANTTEVVLQTIEHHAAHAVDHAATWTYDTILVPFFWLFLVAVVVGIVGGIIKDMAEGVKYAATVKPPRKLTKPPSLPAPDSVPVVSQLQRELEAAQDAYNARRNLS